ACAADDQCQCEHTAQDDNGSGRRGMFEMHGWYPYQQPAPIMSRSRSIAAPAHLRGSISSKRFEERGQVGPPFRSSRFPGSKPPSHADDVQDVAVRVLEPCHFHVPAHMNVTIPGCSRHVVMFESHALVAQCPYDVLDVVANRPCDCGGFVGACILRAVDINDGITAF